MTPFLTNFRRFPITFRRFFKIVLKARRTFPDIYRTFPKIAEDDRRRSEDVSIIHRQIQPIQQKQKAGIVTSLNDTTLAKVSYGKYATRVPDAVAYGIYEWFSS